jgi:RHS repeat-associated protein
MYEPTLARFTSRDPFTARNADLLYGVPDMRGFWNTQMQSHPYLYVGNDPANLTDPSGLQAIRASACAGTDCEYPGGIKTRANPDADASCKRACKAAVVETHEATHRKNMSDCCNRLNKCIDEVRDEAELVRRCQGLWRLWKNVNRTSLELRAGVESCAMAKFLVKQFCFRETLLGPPEVSCDQCCRDARDQLYFCEGSDATAKIECCPFNEDGSPDLDCYRRLVALSGERP